MVFQMIFGFCQFLVAKIFVLGQTAHSKTETSVTTKLSDKTQVGTYYLKDH